MTNENQKAMCKRDTIHITIVKSRGDADLIESFKKQQNKNVSLIRCTVHAFYYRRNNYLVKN